MITKLLRAEEAASIMDVSKSFVYKLIRAGELPAVRMGKSVRIKPEVLTDFIVACSGIGSNSISNPVLKWRKKQ